jgi:hypothetical protein
MPRQKNPFDTPVPETDPAQVQNEKILQMREDRAVAKEVKESLDLGLGLQETPAATAAEFLDDEWDKKAFGEKVKTTTRVIYGPDPIVNNCPEFHMRLERHGLEAIAAAFEELIMQKGEFAAPDPIMSKGIRSSIAKFGKEATARAFRDRVMRIPVRTVEVETDTAMDPLLSNPMREAATRYGRPGMAVKFLSDRCNQVLGMRGYEVVKDPRGDVVKVGNLIMAEIPQDWADRRLRHYADESVADLKEQEAIYYENAARQIASEGGRAAGASPMRPGDSIRADPMLNTDYTGEERESGINFRSH